MDAKVSRAILTGIKWFFPLAASGFMGAMAAHYAVRERLAIQEERYHVLAEDHAHTKRALERLEADAARRSAVSPDGFSDGAIRHGLNTTIRNETRHLLPREEYVREMQLLRERNNLR